MASVLLYPTKARSYFPSATRVEWSSPDSALENDGVGARATLGSGITEGYTEYLCVDACNAEIPTNTQIDGIKMYVKKYQDNRNDEIFDERAALTVGYPTPAGENKPSIEAWSTRYTTYTYGGETDLWEYEWTPALINQGTFGGVLSASHDTAYRSTCYVDAIWFEVFYSFLTAGTLSLVLPFGKPKDK